jgi:hypothetical protein
MGTGSDWVQGRRMQGEGKRSEISNLCDEIL